MAPRFQVQLKILKTPSEVFEAVVNPGKLGGYFLESAGGPLTEGATVKWKFAEVSHPFDVVVREVTPPARIVFEWPSAKSDPDTRVEMVFKPLGGGATMVQISESGWPDSAAGVKASYDNNGGWMHMMCCLKAYLEYGVNLRAGGAF